MLCKLFISTHVCRSAKPTVLLVIWCNFIFTLIAIICQFLSLRQASTINCCHDIGSFLFHKPLSISKKAQPLHYSTHTSTSYPELWDTHFDTNFKRKTLEKIWMLFNNSHVRWIFYHHMSYFCMYMVVILFAKVLFKVCVLDKTVIKLCMLLVTFIFKLSSHFWCLLVL